MRTQEEILQRFQAAKARDLLGFEVDEYLGLLDFDHVQPFLKPTVTRDDWKPLSLVDIDEGAKSYLAFWKEKIDNERGISVVRATMHYTAWKWLLGHPDADTFPGSINGGDGGLYQKIAYNYIKKQIESGEWDRLTEAAQVTA